MKKSIFLFIFIFLTLSASGCTAAVIPVPPTFTPSLVPPTFTPKPTVTATATPTATATQDPLEALAAMDDEARANMYPDAEAERAAGNEFYPSKLKRNLVVKFDSNKKPVDVYDIVTGQTTRVVDVPGIDVGSRGKDWTPFSIQVYKTLNGDILELPFSGLVKVHNGFNTNKKKDEADRYYPTFNNVEDLFKFLIRVEGIRYSKQEVIEIAQKGWGNFRETVNRQVSGYDGRFVGDFTLPDGTEFYMFGQPYAGVLVISYVDANKVAHFAVVLDSTLPEGMDLQTYLNTMAGNW